MNQGSLQNVNDRILRAARQAVETDKLFGLDAIPIKHVAPVEIDFAALDPETESISKKKSKALEELRKRHDWECPHCTVATYHTQTVFGEGNPDAQLMFIGEAPGADEDASGRPFVGRAGKLLERMINAMGLKRSDVYIANILKSRPPNNATPTISEVEKCAPYLAEQVRIIEPEVIVTLGAPSTKFILQTTEGISKLRGKWHTYQRDELQVPVMPTFHPAYLLRQYTPENRAKVWSDLQMAMKAIGIG